MQVSYMFLEEPEYTQEVKESLKVWIIQLQASIRSATELRRDWNLREEARKFTIDIYDMDPVEAIEKAPKFLDHMPDLINYQVRDHITFVFSRSEFFAHFSIQAYVDADTIQQRAQVLIQFFHIQLRLFRKRLEIMGSAGSASGAQSTEKEVWKSMLQENQEDASADKDKKKQVEKFRARLEGKSVPENVMAVIEENFVRCFVVPPHLSIALTTNYP
jgi:ATP-dependent Lon protease